MHLPSHQTDLMLCLVSIKLLDVSSKKAEIVIF